MPLVDLVPGDRTTTPALAPGDAPHDALATELVLEAAADPVGVRPSSAPDR